MVGGPRSPTSGPLSFRGEWERFISTVTLDKGAARWWGPWDPESGAPAEAVTRSRGLGLAPPGGPSSADRPSTPLQQHPGPRALLTAPDDSRGPRGAKTSKDGYPQGQRE